MFSRSLNTPRHRGQTRAACPCLARNDASDVATRSVQFRVQAFQTRLAATSLLRSDSELLPGPGYLWPCALATGQACGRWLDSF